MRTRFSLCLAASVAVLSLAGSAYAADPPAKPKAPGLGDPGQLQKITVETGRVKDGVVNLTGRDAVQQIVVTGNYSSGQERDLTRTAKYTSNPPGIVSVDETGY